QPQACNAPPDVCARTHLYSLRKDSLQVECETCVAQPPSAVFRSAGVAQVVTWASCPCLPAQVYLNGHNKSLAGHQDSSEAANHAAVVRAMICVRLAASTIPRTSEGWQQSAAPAPSAADHSFSSASRCVHTISRLPNSCRRLLTSERGAISRSITTTSARFLMIESRSSCKSRASDTPLKWFCRFSARISAFCGLHCATIRLRGFIRFTSNGLAVFTAGEKSSPADNGRNLKHWER